MTLDLFALDAPILTKEQFEANLTSFNTDFSYPATQLTKQSFVDAGYDPNNLDVQLATFVEANKEQLFGFQEDYLLVISYPTIDGVDYVVAFIYPGVGGAAIVTQDYVIFDNFTGSTLLVAESDGGLFRSDAGVTNDTTNTRAWATTKFVGDFTWAGNVHYAGAGTQMLLGLSNILPSGNPYGVKAAGWGFRFKAEANGVEIWDVGGSTALSAGDYPFEISRVGSMVTYKINGTQIGTAQNLGTDDMYAAACIQLGNDKVLDSQKI